MSPAGVLPIDKPAGPTSHDIVAIVRRALPTPRVGHTGTLDPFASGLLILCVGWATRLAEYVTSLPKTYRGVIRLGERTDTDDRTGAIIARSDAWRGLGAAELESALREHVGVIEQRPPDYSAKKVEGRRAYAVARGGGKPELRARTIRVRRLELLDLAPPDLTLEIECSSGTYIRAIARDLGERLGTHAHLRELRRTEVGDFRVEDAATIVEGGENDLAAALRPPQAALAHLPALEVDEESAEAFGHGRTIADPRGSEEGRTGPVAIFHGGAILGVAAWHEGRLRPRKVLPPALR